MITYGRAAAVCAGIFAASCSSHATALHGTVFPGKMAAPFALTDERDRPLALRDERGKVVALYFGFTRCKDVCPQTLQVLQRAADRSGLGERIRMLFISVDPGRDTPAAMRSFLARQHLRTTTGLTGTRRELAPVWQKYGVDVVALRHDVGHSSYIYLIGPNGTLREILHEDAGTKAIAADMLAIAS